MSCGQQGAFSSNELLYALVALFAALVTTGTSFCNAATMISSSCVMGSES